MSPLYHLSSFLHKRSLELALGTIPLMLAFAWMSILYPLWQIWHIRPAELLRTGSSASTGKARLLGSRFAGVIIPVGTLVLRNLGRSRIRALIVVLSFCFSALLLMIMLNGVLAPHQALQGTLLGDDVLFQTAVPQIVGCVIALVLTLLSVADLLLRSSAHHSCHKSDPSTLLLHDDLSCEDHDHISTNKG